jgi:predicted TIM-barrel fold metal-dependent hydrolase
MHRSRRLFLKAGAAAATAVLGALSRGRRLGAQTLEGDRIDVHQHFVSPDYHALLTRMNASSPVPGYGRWTGYSPADSVEAMDQAGVRTAMLSITAPGVYFGDNAEARASAREMNEYATARMVGDYPGRFGLFAVLPIPDVEGSLNEIEYAFDTLGASGVGLFTSYGDRWLGDAAFEPIFEELNRRRAVVYTHPIEAACCPNLVGGVTPQTLEYPTDTTRAIMSLIAGGTASRYPDIRFIFSHAGGTLVSIAGRFLGDEVSRESLADAEPDSRLHHVRRFYYDTAGSANPVQMQSLRLLVPDSQIVFGSDYPFLSPVSTVDGLENSGLTRDTLRGVYRENALGILPAFA